MRQGGAMQAVDTFGREGHSGVEAKSHGRRFQVIVDRLRDPDYAEAFLAQAIRDGKAAITAY
jgi:hypothetical protein